MPVSPIDIKRRQRREATLHALLEAQNRHDAAACIACFAHPRYELIASQRVYDGAEEVAEYYATTARMFPDLSFEVAETHHAADAVIVELWMSGTHLGAREGMEPTGKRFHARIAAIFQFRGEELIGARLYYDTGTIARQLA